MKTFTAIVAAVLAAALPGEVAAQQSAATHDWPSYLGGNGSFSETSGVKLVDDMTSVKLLWESQEKSIGFGKALSSAMGTGYAGGTGLLPAGEASAIVAGGLLVHSYYVPSGDVRDASGPARMGEKYEQFKDFWLVSADDAVIGIDASTGKTRWKTVFKGKGINYGAGKRGGWAATPCAAEGKVFAMGTTGRLYCLELATGKTLWESSIGKQHEWLEGLKKEALEVKRLALSGKNLRPYGILACVEGVLLAPDWAGGLLGIDPADGKQLWCASERGAGVLSGFNAPVPVKVAGKTYVAAVSRIGELRLIDLKTGAILWTHPLKSEHLTQPVFGRETLIAFASHPKFSGEQFGKSKDPNSAGILAGFRLTEKGAEQVWTAPEQYMTEMNLDAGPSRKVVARDGLVYYSARRQAGEAYEKSRQPVMVVIREKDGKVLSESEVSGWNPYLWGDRLITVTDIQHRPRAANAEIWQMYNPDPADFRPLGGPWHVNGNPPVHTATGGYELPIIEPFADGLFFCRVWGGFRCYDLRKRD